jgi:transcriptional regulator with XRE-family HTH domain
VVNTQQMSPLSNNDILLAQTDSALLQLIGGFIKAKRLQLNKTQQQTADAAGVDRTTLLKMENGAGGNMLSFIQILRAIGELPVLKNFEINEPVSPLLLAKMMQKKKKRAGSSSKNNLPPITATK